MIRPLAASCNEYFVQIVHIMIIWRQIYQKVIEVMSVLYGFKCLNLATSLSREKLQTVTHLLD